MTDTLNIINGTIQSHQTGSLALTADTLIHKILTTPSTSDTKDILEFLKPIIELFIAFIGAFVLVWKYVTQKQKEAAERIIESKRNAYSEFLKDFADRGLNITYNKKIGGIEDDRKRINARNLLLLYGNDKVVQAYNTWVEYTDQDEKNHGNDKDVELWQKILLEIRNDIHGQSKLTEKEIRNLDPFYRG